MCHILWITINHEYIFSLFYIYLICDEVFSAGISVHVKSSEHSLHKKANVCHVMVLSQTVHIGLLSYLTCKCIYTSQQKKGIFWFVGRHCSISFTTKNIGGMEIFGHQFCIY